MTGCKTAGIHNHKCRTIDDEIRDAKIAAAIIGAGYFGPYAAQYVISSAITTPTGLYLLSHAEPIVYGSVGVVGGNRSEYGYGHL
jgi:hypothetical protein